MSWIPAHALTGGVSRQLSFMQQLGALREPYENSSAQQNGQPREKNRTPAR
jgi:hypothetical protein